MMHLSCKEDITMRHPNWNGRGFSVMRKLLALLGAAVCLIGLFYFVLLLTR